MKFHIKRIPWLLVPFLITIGLDRWSKSWATAHLMHSYPRSYWNDFFRFQYALNEGAFLSLGSELHADIRYWILAILPVAVLLYILFYVLTAAELKHWAQLAFGFILGGGGSNIFDRLAEGHVVDFMNMGFKTLRTGIFNVADMGIMAGLFLLLFTMFGKHSDTDASHAERSTEAPEDTPEQPASTEESEPNL